jgi:hypothetical protein
LPLRDSFSSISLQITPASAASTPFTTLFLIFLDGRSQQLIGDVVDLGGMGQNAFRQLLVGKVLS